MSVREVHPLAVLGDQLLEAGLVDRDLALLEALDLVGVDVDAVDLAAELREARRGDEADVAGADDADGFALLHMKRERLAEHAALRCAEAQASADLRDAASEREHLLVAQAGQQRVRDPVDGLARAPGDQPQAAAVVEQLVACGRPACAARSGLSRIGGAVPARALDAVVLADIARLERPCGRRGTCARRGRRCRRRGCGRAAATRRRSRPRGSRPGTAAWSPARRASSSAPWPATCTPGGSAVLALALGRALLLGRRLS